MTELSPGQAELFLKNLLARIHRDGGHYVATHGITKACIEADRIVSELNAGLGPKCVLGEACDLHGFVHGGEAEELRSRFTEYAEDIQDKHKVRGKTVSEELISILDEVDARDSVAFLETRAGRASSDNFTEEDMDDG